MEKLKLDQLGRKSVNEFKEAKKNPIIVVLDNVRSLHNVGSVFRTSDAFLIEALYLCGITGTPPNKEIQKTALGATESVAWTHFSSTKEAILELKERGYKILTLEQASESIELQNYLPEKDCKLALVFGNEVNGVDEEVMKLADTCIEIPQFGVKHSFNISVSAGIVLWDICNKMQKPV